MDTCAQSEASTNGVWKGIRGTVSQTGSVKLYLEFTSGYVGNNGIIFGFGNSSFNTASYPGNDANSFGAQNQGSIYGLSGALNPGWSMGTVVGVAIDLGAKLVWYRSTANSNWNNSGTANPATGTGGLSYTTTGALFPVVSFSGNAGVDSQNGCVLNAGGFSFFLTVPSGFSAWDTGTPTGTGISGTSPTTWDGANKNANVALSGGNLVATQNSATGTWCGVRGTTNYDSGLKYYELTISAYDNTNGHLAGIMDSSQTFANGEYVGSTTSSTIHSMGWQIGTGDVYFRGSTLNGTQKGPVGAVNHVIGFAINLNQGMWWVKDMTAGGNWNNNASADPTTGVLANYLLDNKNIYIGWSGDRVGGASDAVTLNVGATAFTGTLPTGYSAWDAGMTPALMLPARQRMGMPLGLRIR